MNTNKTPETSQHSSRRDFLMEMTALALLGKQPLTAGAAGAPLATNSATQPTTAFATQSSTTPAAGKEKFVAIQIGARSFVDEGVDSVLDTLQQRAGVNVLMPAVFTYGRGLAGRQIPGQPLPDHGVQQYDEIHGGSYTQLHADFDAKSVIKNVRAPELGNFDILADVIPKAKARGMRAYCLFEEAYNPVALVQDWIRNNDLDGIMWESERQGPLNNMVGAHFGKFSGESSAYCFCPYCVNKAAAQGIRVDRVRAGFTALSAWVKQALHSNSAAATATGADAGTNPRINASAGAATGAFVSFWCLLLEYPELIAWQKFWFRSQEEVYALLHHSVKEINPKAQVGWHIMHLVTMSPFYQAEQGYSRIAKSADFLKPCPYNNCAGPRFAQYVRNVHSTVFRDLAPEEVLQFHYRLLGYEHEASLDNLPKAGMSAEYVARETRRALAEVNGAIPIYPGIDIDIPTPVNEKRTQPADVKGAVLAAFRAGAPGVVLSRKYAEMRLTNLAGAGEALRELA